MECSVVSCCIICLHGQVSGFLKWPNFVNVFEWCHPTGNHLLAFILANQRNDFSHFWIHCPKKMPTRTIHDIKPLKYSVNVCCYYVFLSLSHVLVLQRLAWPCLAPFQGEHLLILVLVSKPNSIQLSAIGPVSTSVSRFMAGVGFILNFFYIRSSFIQ